MPPYISPKTPPQHNGTTLIETIVALSILAAVSLASLMGLNTLYNALTISERRATAESLAKSQLEDVKRQPYIEDGCPSPQYQLLDPSQIPTGYGVTISTTCIDGNGNEASQDKGLQKVTVSVRYQDRDILQVSGYKVKE